MTIEITLEDNFPLNALLEDADFSGQVGETLPSFELQATNNKDIHAEKLRDYQIVLFFFSADVSPGCVQILQDLAKLQPSFKAIDTVLLGVSPAELSSLETMHEHLKLNFPLIADNTCFLAQSFQVILQKTLFGEPIQAIQQSTFLINTQGRVQAAWRDINAKGHSQEVLETAHRTAQKLLDQPAETLATALQTSPPYETPSFEEQMAEVDTQDLDENIPMGSN